MVIIEVGKELILENVLSLRKKLTQEEINNEMIKIGKFFESNSINKAGPVVTCTYSAEVVNAVVMMDMEILVPMDRTVDLVDYTLKPIFRLVNAVYARHYGDPTKLQDTYNEMLEFIQKNKLQQITPGYNVTVKDILPDMNPNEIIVDVYVGVSPNIL